MPNHIHGLIYLKYNLNFDPTKNFTENLKNNIEFFKNGIDRNNYFHYLCRLFEREDDPE
ncbi:MAG: hypothetical protein KAI79_14305 [Bacteroidales bacterium]|nr:hypothetical protein [Bacteroidales bacterium]